MRTRDCVPVTELILSRRDADCKVTWRVGHRLGADPPFSLFPISEIAPRTLMAVSDRKRLAAVVGLGSLGFRRGS